LLRYVSLWSVANFLKSDAITFLIGWPCRYRNQLVRFIVSLTAAPYARPLVFGTHSTSIPTMYFLISTLITLFSLVAQVVAQNATVIGCLTTGLIQSVRPHVIFLMLTVNVTDRPRELGESPERHPVYL
jgi:hypothetical protein